MEKAAHILVVDDHREIRDSLGQLLRRYDFRASLAEDARAARRVLRDGAVDLVVADIMMPGEDGLSLCRSIRETMDIPVILLTARGEDTDRIVGLEIGADDYIVKPFNMRELVARIRAVLRRTQTLPRVRGQPDRGLHFAGWRLDLTRRIFNRP